MKNKRQARKVKFHLSFSRDLGNDRTVIPFLAIVPRHNWETISKLLAHGSQVVTRVIITIIISSSSSISFINISQDSYIFKKKSNCKNEW